MRFSRSSLIAPPGNDASCSLNILILLCCLPSVHHIGDARSAFVESKTSFLNQEEERLSASHLEVSLLQRTIWSRLTWRGSFGGVKFGG